MLIYFKYAAKLIRLGLTIVWLVSVYDFMRSDRILSFSTINLTDLPTLKSISSLSNFKFVSMTWFLSVGQISDKRRSFLQYSYNSNWEIYYFTSLLTYTKE